MVFEGEPLVRVEGPLAQAQLVETILLSMLGYPTLIASKAARIVEAAQGRGVVDFGARRGHGRSGGIPQRAGRLTSRGSPGRATSRPRGGWASPPSGRWPTPGSRRSRPSARRSAPTPACSRGRRRLLVDTYDVAEGVREAAAIEPPIQAIRLDSGDLLAISKAARAILDEKGRPSVKILASNDLDEFQIDWLLKAGAPIDAFGVGTELITSRDAPALSMVYKLVELGGVGRIKRSPGKKTYPLAKQVVRMIGEDGRFASDFVMRADEVAEGRGLLVPVIQKGERIGPLPGLDPIREHCRAQLARLPDSLRGVDARPGYRIEYSEALGIEAARLGLA